MTTETKTQKGLTISFDDGDFTTGTVSVLLDLDMRTGTPVDETGWLDGNAGGSYPGSLTGFTAQNTDGNALGSLRMVTFTVNVVQAATVEPLLFSAGASKILGIVGYASATAAKDITITMTNTGNAGADATVAPLATTGTLPCLILDSESANQVVQVTVLLLN